MSDTPKVINLPEPDDSWFDVNDNIIDFRIPGGEEPAENLFFTFSRAHTFHGASYIRSYVVRFVKVVDGWNRVVIRTSINLGKPEVAHYNLDTNLRWFAEPEQVIIHSLFRTTNNETKYFETGRGKHLNEISLHHLPNVVLTRYVASNPDVFLEQMARVAMNNLDFFPYYENALRNYGKKPSDIFLEVKRAVEGMVPDAPRTVQIKHEMLMVLASARINTPEELDRMTNRMIKMVNAEKAQVHH